MSEERGDAAANSIMIAFIRLLLAAWYPPSRGGAGFGVGVGVGVVGGKDIGQLECK